MPESAQVIENKMEARTGVEPVNKGFADLSAKQTTHSESTEQLNRDHSGPHTGHDKSETRAIVLPLSRGLHALVDESDYDAVAAFKWSIHDNQSGGLYACRVVKGRRIFLHRWLLGLTDPNVQCDHKDGNTLNNTRQNLRPATNAENGANRRKRKQSASQFKGVKLAGPGKFSARIKVNGKQKHIGTFDSEADAAKAYDAAAVKAFGDFAWLNFRDCDTRPEVLA